MDNYNSTFNKFKVEQELVNKSLETEINSLITYRDSSKTKEEMINNSLMTVMQFCTLINHLQIQD